MKELSEKVSISPSSLSTLIDELNFDFQGIAEIKKNSTLYELKIYEDISYLDILHAIYQNSNVLKCLCYMITNDTNISFSEFAEEHYLTRPTAYRIRENCVNYLNAIGLDVKKNKIIGEEYRIRFLIGLLKYKYGFDCYNIDNASIILAREFIISTNDKIDMNFLECTSVEYGYFEYLLILAWKRKDYPVSLKKSKDLEKLKQLFIYAELKRTLKETIEPKLNITFSNEDYDYLFLVYLCTNSCVFADKWQKKDIELVHKIVFSNLQFSNLVSRFEKKCCISMTQSHAFRAVIIYFYKKCLFDLHCIIPDKHFYLDTSTDPLKQMILQCVSEIIHSWKSQNDIPYPIEDGHLCYLACQVSSILQQFMNPVEILVVSDLISEIEVMKLYLTRAYSQDRITIKPVVINKQNLSFISNLSNSVIIVKKIFAPVVASYNLPKSNIIVPINIEINTIDKQFIINAVRKCEKNIFMDFITK